MDNRIENMTDRKCMINIASLMATSSGEREEIIFSTEANYQVKDGKAYLRYEESEVSGMSGSKTLLKYDGKQVNIRRFGSVNSVLPIVVDEVMPTFYKTPYGEFSLQIKGHEINWNAIDKLDIIIRYTMMIEGNDEDTEITIHITES